MIIRCVIVEDESLSRGILEKYCAVHPELELLAAFPAAEPALEFLKTNETDLVFLDVMLPGINGFEFLDQLPLSPRVILTTSDTSYAFTAFEYHVTDYLKKPISHKRFEESVEKAKESGIGQAKNGRDVFIKSEGKYMRLQYADILYIESMGDYVRYVTDKGEHITHSTLKAVEAKLDEQFFLKVHRCYIVNMKTVTDLVDNMLQIGSRQVPISKSCRPEVMKRLKIAK